MHQFQLTIMGLFSRARRVLSYNLLQAPLLNTWKLSSADGFPGRCASVQYSHQQAACRTRSIKHKQLKKDEIITKGNAKMRCVKGSVHSNSNFWLRICRAVLSPTGCLPYAFYGRQTNDREKNRFKKEKWNVRNVLKGLFILMQCSDCGFTLQYSHLQAACRTLSIKHKQ